jgi:hypothetical protein
MLAALGEQALRRRAQQCFTGLVATVSLSSRGLRRSTGCSLPRTPGLQRRRIAVLLDGHMESRENRISWREGGSRRSLEKRMVSIASNERRTLTGNSALEDTLNRLPYAVEELRNAQEKDRTWQKLSARDEKVKKFLKMLYTCPYRDRKKGIVRL